jgi:hypothetical protein
MNNAGMTPGQKKRAIVSAVVLASMAIGIYLVVVLKFVIYR